MNENYYNLHRNSNTEMQIFLFRFATVPSVVHLHSAGHWVFEVNKFIPSKYLRPLQYAGPPCERERLRAQLRRYNLVVASYDIVRKDIGFFSAVRWNYCVLDEVSLSISLSHSICLSFCSALSTCVKRVIELSLQ